MINAINTGLSISILVLFLIIIGVGYVYVDESRKNNDDAKHAIFVVNQTQNQFLEEWKQRQTVDNIRFNQTLKGLASSYALILNLSDTVHHTTETNLNLTKFNRASLVDTNNVLHEIAKQLNVTVPPFDPTKLN